jgi:formate hydrogenlyase subunit 4
MNTVLYIFIQLIAILLIAPFLNGVNKKVKALTQKRKGAPVLQQYYDLFKLMKKHSVVSDTASSLYKAAPFMVFATALVASLLVPATTLITSV